MQKLFRRVEGKKAISFVARACMEQGEIEDAIAILKKAKGLGMPYIDEFSSDQCSRKEEKASLRALTLQMKEIKRLITEYSEKRKTEKKMEKEEGESDGKGLVWW